MSDAGQNVAEVLEDAVIATFVCVGKSRPGNRSAKSDMVEFVAMGIQAGFDVPQTCAPRQLGVRQTKELIECGEGFYPVLPSISANADIEFVPREKLKQLPEDRFYRNSWSPS